MRARVLVPVLVIAVVLVGLVMLLPRRQGVAVQRSGPAGQGVSTKVEHLKSRPGSEATAADPQGPKSDSEKSRASVEPGSNPSNAAQSAAPMRVAEAHSASGAHDASKKTQPIDEARQVAIETRVQELLDLGMEDDPQSLQTILSELSNSDPEIRSAAVEATIQFGSRDAIPELENAMLWAENAQQRKELADAIEFLKLPNLTEVAASLPTLSNLQPTGRTATGPRATTAVRNH